MAKNGKKPNQKLNKRVKKLEKRLARDLEEMITLCIESGDLNKKDIGSILGDVGSILAGTEGKSLRKAGRFLGHLHDSHEVIEDKQLINEEHDQRILRYLQVLSEKGKTPAEIARIMRKDGNEITASGIRRILSNET